MPNRHNKELGFRPSTRRARIETAFMPRKHLTRANFRPSTRRARIETVMDTNVQPEQKLPPFNTKGADWNYACYTLYDEVAGLPPFNTKGADWNPFFLNYSAKPVSSALQHEGRGLKLQILRAKAEGRVLPPFNTKGADWNMVGDKGELYFTDFRPSTRRARIETEDDISRQILTDLPPFNTKGADWN